MHLKKMIARFLRIPATMRGLEEGSFYWPLDSEELSNAQLRSLNEAWRDAVRNVPFYAWWKKEHNLPDEVTSLDEYAKWPILKKSDLQSRPDLLTRNSTRPHHTSVTGGATGEPLRFGTYPEQGRRVNSCMLMARAGLDFLPGDKVFLLWGHRHFYGLGARARLRFLVRRFKDWLNNTYRADACDLTAKSLVSLLGRINRVDPEIVVAYSGSLLVLVRFAREKGLKFKGGRLRTIICSAGPLLKNERDEVSAFFGAPVYMEYGAMDTGQMAYMQKDGRYHVFQHYRMIHTVNDGVGDVNVLTSLSKDYLPFFRYYVGDYLSGCRYTSDGRVVSFDEVWGRGSDVIVLPSGNKLQVLSLMVCVEACSKALAYQIIRRGSSFKFCLQTSAPLTEEERSHFFDCAYAITPELKSVDMVLEEKADLIKAKSGKIRLLIEE